MISSVLADFYDTSTAVFFPLWVVCYSKFLIKLNKTVHLLCSIVLIPVLVMTGSFLCNFKIHNSLCFSTEIMHPHSCPSGSKKTFFAIHQQIWECYHKSSLDMQSGAVGITEVSGCDHCQNCIVMLFFE